MEKSELRKLLFEQMCYAVENIDRIYYYSPVFTNTHFQNNECPEPFKPDIADKLIFNHILDKVIDNIHEEINNREEMVGIMGLNILAGFYYPEYGKWRTMPELLPKELIRIYEPDLQS